MTNGEDENGVPTLTIRADDPAALLIGIQISNALTHHLGVVSHQHVKAARDFRFAAQDWLDAHDQHPKLPE